MINMKKFKINTDKIEEITKNYKYENIENNTNKIECFLNEELKLVDDKGNIILNGDEIVKKIFPSNNNYDVFISHSHNDEECAKKFANFLRKELNLKVFLDSEIWGSADDFLKKIDDKYCKTDDIFNTYSYEKRNFSTSHVHLLLVSAIACVINNSKKFIFIESENTKFSISNIKNNEYTKSPWIYTELLLSNLLTSLNTISAESSSEAKQETSLYIAREINISGFISLNDLKKEEIKEELKK